MTDVLPHQAVEAAVRAMLADEVARVHGAAPALPESDGWRPTTGPGDQLHRTEWSLDSWRWFEPVDLSVVDEMVVLVFRWLDPATPEIVYIAVAHVDGLSNASNAALIARQQFRRLLEAGWRDTVERTWLASRKVLIRRAARDRHAKQQAEVHEIIWNQRRDAQQFSAYSPSGSVID